MNQTKGRLFYGWLIVGFALLSMIITNGSTIGGLSVFYKPMLDDLQNLGAITDITRPTITAFGGAVTLYTVAAFAIPAGYLIDKTNIRVMISIGCALLGTALIVYSQAISPIYIYTAHFMFGVALCCCGAMINSILVSNWFIRKRGLAMGIVYTGTSIGGSSILLIAAPLIGKFGWRTALVGVSCLLWFLLLPLVWLVVRVKPGDKGLLPDGDPAPVENVTATNDAVSGLSLKEAMRKPAFWVFALCEFGIFYAIFVVVQQIILYLQSPAIGMTKEAAGASLATMGFASIAGKFLFGWLSDRLPRKTVLLVGSVCLFLPTLFLFSLTLSNAMFFMIPFGVAYGGIFVCAKLVTIELFGLREAGKIMGTLTVIETIGGATGLLLTGVLASRFGGDYAVAFYPIIIVTFISFLSALILSRMNTSFSTQERG